MTANISPTRPAAFGSPRTASQPWLFAERIGNELRAAALMESANRRDRSAVPRLASSISMLGTVALSRYPPALVNSEFDKRECLLEVLVIGGLSDLPCRIRTRGPGPINQRGPG